MNNTPTKVGLPVCLCTGNLSSPATQLHVPYDCTSPVTKPAPTVSPAALIPWHYLYSTPLLLSTASARGSRSCHWFLVKKVLAGQAAFAGWLVTVWQHWSVLSLLGSLSLPGGTAWCLFPSSFLVIWFSQNLLECDGWYFCFSALFQVIFHNFSTRVENF